MTQPDPAIGVMDVNPGFDRALEGAKRFASPFRLSAWFCVGLCGFLESCEAGGGGSRALSQAGRVGGELSKHAFDPVNVALVAVAAVVGFLVWALCAWLASRGTFMLVRAVALNDDDVGAHWSASAEPAWSLFVFKVLAFVCALVPVLVIGGTLALTSGAFEGGGPHLPALLAAGVVLAVGFVLWGVMGCLLRNLVAPLMWRFDLPCLGAWALLYRVAQANPGQLLAFVAIRAALAVLLGIVQLVLGLATCCVGFLPVVSTTLVAPLIVFERAWSLHVLESLGPDFAMFVGTAKDGACASAPQA